ncbi:hypothetical protein HDU76_013110 [Blyttiomyces sp. JEL0837]|nr:hypothetical protein HDU76_013110 [Blyttiomyces sp. JEL0837]
MADATLASVVRRLEAATLRLEDIVRSKGISSSADSTAATAGSTLSGSSAASNSPAVAAFQSDIIDGPLKTFLDLANGVGGVVAEQAGHVKAALLAQKQLIELAASSKKPAQTDLPKLVGPTQTEIMAIIGIKDKLPRSSPLFNHLSAVAEGIPALGWVVVEPAPVPYIAEMKDSAQFYSNRVIKEYKEKDKSHVDLMNAFVAVLTELGVYVKKFHTTGLSWNPRGGDASSFTPSAAPAASTPAPAAASAAAPPKPAGLFSAINQEGLTSALRKVDKSEMTHKNPELRGSSIVPAADKPAPVAAAPKFGAAAPKAPPKLALEGKKWVVENYTNHGEIVAIKDAEISHAVYIYGCTNSTIQIHGKVTAITIDNCKKTGVIVESAVSTVDLVNCKSSQLQITGVVPTVVVDKTDGLQVYVSKASLDANIEILTAKSSEVNVLLEGAGEDGGYAERAVAEQMKTVVQGGKLVTTIVEHKG